ncbi:16S rRNA (cytosine(1402)-N(4))-methyltransferase RsmH [Castellaniella sp.]|uniref:16S rRNA (cytosine(1402)-N(4))-methyltransferase RsmH n=1 Tax=Castellaniella sp. TaxID=1955812 RepID=UPI003569760D
MVSAHRTVLLEPAVDALLDPGFGGKGPTGQAPSLEGVYMDGTFGRGGHARHLLTRLLPRARLLVFDRDPQAVAVARELQREDPRVIVVHDTFAAMDEHLDGLGIACLDGILLDLGVSSPQLDEAGRGFSFLRDGPLDMRMDTRFGQTAAEWLAQAEQNQIKEVIAHYGEERFALRIAKAIVARRQSRPLCTTGELAELIASAVPTREKGRHPATRSFQAIRIHINDELTQLAHTLPTALKRLCPRGRLAVISFHSLEDRMVKQCFAAAAHPGQAQARLPIPESAMPQPWVRLLGRRRPDAAEVAENPRARSAVLRAVERTSEPMPAHAVARLRSASGWGARQDPDRNRARRRA